MIKIIVLFGAPGAGKGTIAQYLLDNYNVVHFSTGNLLRNEVKSGTEIGKKVTSILGSGGLVGDEIVNMVVESHLLNALSDSSIILLDGYPRTVDQAKFLDAVDAGKLRALIRVVEIDVDHEIVVSRISGRLVCAKCGSTFSSTQLQMSGSSTSVCGRCGGNLVKRADDDEVVIRKRLKEYVNMTMPVSEYYADRVTKISGNVAPENVARNVDEVLCGLGIKKRR